MLIWSLVFFFEVTQNMFYSMPWRRSLSIYLNFFSSWNSTLSHIFLLFFLHLYVFPGLRPKPTDLVTCHLSFIHMVKFFIAVFLVSPEPLSQWVIRHFFFSFFMSRVMMSLSICTAYLLSTIQDITISPSTSCLATLKQKSSVYILYWLF